MKFPAESNSEMGRGLTVDNRRQHHLRGVDGESGIVEVTEKELLVKLEKYQETIKPQKSRQGYKGRHNRRRTQLKSRNRPSRTQLIGF